MSQHNNSTKKPAHAAKSPAATGGPLTPKPTIISSKYNIDANRVKGCEILRPPTMNKKFRLRLLKLGSRV